MECRLPVRSRLVLHTGTLDTVDEALPTYSWPPIGGTRVPAPSRGHLPGLLLRRRGGPRTPWRGHDFRPSSEEHKLILNWGVGNLFLNPWWKLRGWPVSSRIEKVLLSSIYPYARPTNILGVAVQLICKVFLRSVLITEMNIVWWLFTKFSKSFRIANFVWRHLCIVVGLVPDCCYFKNEYWERAGCEQNVHEFQIWNKNKESPDYLVKRKYCLLGSCLFWARLRFGKRTNSEQDHVIFLSSFLGGL